MASADPNVNITNFRSHTDSITAHSGGGQTNGVRLVKIISQISVSAADHDSVVLPVAQKGLIAAVVNQGGHSIDVYPEVGDQVDALGLNNPYTLATVKTAMFFCFVDGKWGSMLSA